MRTGRDDFLKAAGAAAIIPWLKPPPPDTLNH
jgi:hypothetical protein